VDYVLEPKNKIYEAEMFYEAWPIPLRVFIVTMTVVVLLLIVCKCCAGGMGQKASVSRVVQRLVRQARTWDATSRQDAKPLVALIHADYAAAYAHIAMILQPDSQLRALASELDDRQHAAIQEVVRRAPALKPEGMFSMHLQEN
jgi:hypothetical protein